MIDPMIEYFDLTNIPEQTNRYCPNIWRSKEKRTNFNHIFGLDDENIVQSRKIRMIIYQNVLVCDSNERYEMMENILKNHSNEKILLFCNRKIDCDRISNQIYRRLRISSSSLHGC